MKEASHKILHISFYLYEMTKIGKSMQTESRLAVAQGWGYERTEGLIAKGYGFSF